MPESASKKLREAAGTGRSLAVDGRFDPALLAAVARTERFSRRRAAVMRAALKIPISQFYWNGQLKKNGRGRGASPPPARRGARRCSTCT